MLYPSPQRQMQCDACAFSLLRLECQSVFHSEFQINPSGNIDKTDTAFRLFRTGGRLIQGILKLSFLFCFHAKPVVLYGN